jgi:polar amino acid transport system substrate-binding protein
VEGSSFLPPMSGPVISRRTFVVATAAVVALLPKGARAAERLLVTSEDAPPYAFNYRGHRKGFAVEKVARVLDALHIRDVDHSMTRTAMFKGLDDDTIDLAFPFTETPLRKQKYLLVGPLYTTRFVLAVRTEDGQEPVGLPFIEGKRVGLVDRHRYPAAFDAVQNTTRLPCSSLTLALRRLSYGRVDAVIGDRSSMQANILSLGLEEQIHVSPNAIASVPTYVLFPKSRATLAAAFGDVLHKMEAAGNFKDLETRYPTVDPPK